METTIESIQRPILQMAEPFGCIDRSYLLTPLLAKALAKRGYLVAATERNTQEWLPQPKDKSILLISSPDSVNVIPVAEAAGHEAAIVAFNVMEGTLGLSLASHTRIACTMRDPMGEYHRMTFLALPEEFGFERQPDQPLTLSDVRAQNANLIDQYASSGFTGNDHFNSRVRYTLRVYEKALDWIEAKQRMHSM